MEFEGLSFGYWPNTPACTAPGDRRRFIFYAEERGLTHEIADTQSRYDIVYLTSRCNISAWLAYKKRHPETKIVFELIDPRLQEKSGLLMFLRGAARYLQRREDKLYLDYRNAFRKMVRAADAVVCSTPLQKDFLAPLNDNIHVSLDHFSDDITHFKKDYEPCGKLKLVWEGQAVAAHNLLYLNDVFRDLRDRIELHIITDPAVKYPFGLFDKDTKKLLAPLACDFTIHKWKKESFSRIIADCDLALIPMYPEKEVMWSKPENKLLLLWEIGIPVLTTDTPAYKRVMDDAGLSLYCNKPEDWKVGISRFAKHSAEQRKALVGRSQRYLKGHHTKNMLLEAWDNVMRSVL